MELAEFSKETLADIQVRPIERSEETQYQQQMARHHYLGALGKIWRDALVCCDLARAVGGATESIGVRTEMRRP